MRIWQKFFLWAGDGIVIRGQAYGIRSIRVDGHDAVAIYTAVHEARQMAIQEGAPVLIEVVLKFIYGFVWPFGLWYMVS